MLSRFPGTLCTELLNHLAHGILIAWGRAISALGVGEHATQTPAGQVPGPGPGVVSGRQLPTESFGESAPGKEAGQSQSWGQRRRRYKDLGTVPAGETALRVILPQSRRPSSSTPPTVSLPTPALLTPTNLLDAHLRQSLSVGNRHPPASPVYFQQLPLHPAQGPVSE